ncbi:arginine deiminase [Borreliella californiensis]|uniref:Arginine deiminase n=1 Tax=Borreliella californiensis TaxID=373543 RepID=A0A7W9ZML0_9SPIR|nr:arginine deiminase [Borreliella californiensis]MBB6212949.1 arginine deiminase [Borreliella californiensis]WKC92084.1 arginine deiminase [Borreliella californiensis]WNY70835.1 arginine deiminase [Borreliella californiensis]
MEEYLNPINIFSEIGRLKKVLLHRPGEELENLTPFIMKNFLFDDIPYLKVARQEHEVFVNTLKNNSVEIEYVEDLVSEVLASSVALKNKFISQFIFEAEIKTDDIINILKDYFSNLTVDNMVSKMISGVAREELKDCAFSLDDLVNGASLFIIDPMPNVLFTRDPFASIGNGITINKMFTKVRRRETIFAEYIFKYHSIYKENVPIWLNRWEETSLEGGDEFVLSKDLLVIGISERTEAESVEKLAFSLFKNRASFNTILAFKIPKSRIYMHLDTVFTQIDYNVFTSFTSDDMYFSIYVLTCNSSSNKINIKKEKAKLKDVLSFYLGRKVDIIKCAGGDLIHGAREQWNDGANILAIAPGEVVAYSRNHVTNKLLEENGIKVHRIPSSELSRGRGGPRCMSMPLVREDI